MARRNPKVDPPKAGATVVIIGVDAQGEWRMEATRKNYTAKPKRVAAFMDGDTAWRFVSITGERIAPCDVVAWDD